MVTVYLDKQVFSHLFKAKEEKYIRLREKILSHKDEFIYFYSNAHLFDLQKDLTSCKYDEMEFMQSIVDGNRLIYEAPNIMVLKQSPHDAFRTIGEIGDFSWLKYIDFSQITKEQKKAINNIVDITIKDFKGELDSDWLTKRIPISEDELQVDKQTFVSLIERIAYHFYENKESYKNIRDNTIAMYNPTLITAEEESPFNEQFASSPLGLSFGELVKAALTQTGLSSIDPAIVYSIAYIFLDLFGVNKETRKKVRFQNMQTDSCHSFFGSYCDCIVSDDEGMRRKCKVLYKLFNIGAKVYSIDEFIERFNKSIKDNEKSAHEYIGEIFDDCLTMQIKKIEITPEHTLLQLNTSCTYFGYFNYMSVRRTKDETDIILYKNNDFSQSILAKEIEIIVNRFVRVFNDIGANFALFDEANEFPQINTGNWARVLILNSADIYLTKFGDAPMLCLWIKLK